MFKDREEAGIILSRRLQKENLINAVVISIPRGGVVVGNEVARNLGLAHAVLIVKKIGAPDNPELAVGATGSDGVVYWDNDLLERLNIDKEEQKQLLKKTIETIRLREKSLGIEIPDVAGKTAVIVDDGVATGATAIASGLILKKLGASSVILATPLISKGTKDELSEYFDEIISVETPDNFQAVGQFYRSFPQIEDSQVKMLLKTP